MTNGDLPTRPDIISEVAWDLLTERYQRVVAFMAVHIGEDQTTKEIRLGADLETFSTRDLSDLGVKLRSKHAGVTIKCVGERGPFVLWRMEIVEPKEGGD